MLCLPLIERELRIAVRKQRPERARLKLAAIAAGIAVFFVLLSALTGSQRVGAHLEQVLWLVALYSVLRVPLLTAGVLAQERQNQTLGLLFLSGLGAWEVFAGKLISSALLVFVNLLAVFPVLGLPFLMGGVSFHVFIGTVCLLPTLMVFALAISMLASVLSRDDGTAVALSFVLGTLLCLLPPIVYYAQEHFSPGSHPSLWWWRVSPAFGPHLLWLGLRSTFPVGERIEFWRNLGFTLVWAAVFLAFAAFALSKLWREREAAGERDGWSARWQEFFHGSRSVRKKLAASWLEVNPFVWFAARDRQPATLGWLVLFGVTILWLACWALWPRSWPSVQNFFITATLLNSALAWIFRQAVASQIAQPRRDGSYEFLLTTPLPPNEIVSGTLEAVGLQLKPLGNALLGLNGLMMAGGLATRPWNLAALTVYVLMWLVLLVWTWSIAHWRSGLLRVMWVSLNCAHPAHAVWRSSGLNTWSWIWILFNLRSFGSQFRNFPTGSVTEIVVVGCVAFGVFITWPSSRYSASDSHLSELKWDPERHRWLPTGGPKDKNGRQWGRRLINEFREIVREPLPDPTDPRFKKWNVSERFPWGWEMVQQQLHERVARELIPGKD